MALKSSVCAIGPVLAAFGLVTGCAELPTAGPSGRAVATSASASLTLPSNDVSLQYALVSLTPAVLANFNVSGYTSLLGSFDRGHGPAPEIVVGVGDTVQVTVFESSAGGLFIPADAGSRPGNFVTLPNQTVDRTGVISVPYAGQI